MGNKLIAVVLFATLMVIFSGCASTSKMTSNIPNNNASISVTATPENMTAHPAIKTNFTVANVTSRPAKKITMLHKQADIAGENRVALKMSPEYTSNWAGYSVISAKGTVTDVKGSWIVPTVKTKTANQYSCNWIGMDGENSNTVEQIGTASETDSKGRPSYYAWFEFYPEPAYYVPMTIHPGDKITAEVSYSKGQITLLLTNVNTKKTFRTTHDGKGYSRSCAEWIVEAPWNNGVLPLMNFGTTSIGKSYTFVSNTCFATINGKTGNINSFGSSVKYITMVNNNGQIKAQPGDLSKDGTSFQTTWKRAS